MTYSVRVFPKFRFAWPTEIRQGEAVRAVIEIPWHVAVMFLLRHPHPRFGRRVRYGASGALNK